MSEQWRAYLVAAAQKAEQVRTSLAQHGQLYGGESGFHPAMETVNFENATLLERAMTEIGWPGPAKVGEDGAAAVVYILRNSPDRPMIQRHALKLMLAAVPTGQASAVDAAYLFDRIAIYEGKPQRFGTQFDWDDKGQLSPAPIADPKKVDELRASIGLPPMKETTHKMREGAAKSGEKAPSDLKQRRTAFEEWTRKVGWRA